jgi:hypothetical protein
MTYRRCRQLGLLKTCFIRKQESGRFRRLCKPLSPFWFLRHLVFHHGIVLCVCFYDLDSPFSFMHMRFDRRDSTNLTIQQTFTRTCDMPTTSYHKTTPVRESCGPTVRSKVAESHAHSRQTRQTLLGRRSPTRRSVRQQPTRWSAKRQTPVGNLESSQSQGYGPRIKAK